MAKIKKTTAFFCQECGYESAKWTGQCPACHAWNSMVEEPVRVNAGTPLTTTVFGAGGAGSLAGSFAGTGAGRGGRKEPVSLSCVEDTEDKRLLSGFSELDRVLGGGIVKGSMTLVGGDPGIGKSTLLLLQTAIRIASPEHAVLYVSGEESIRQIKLRASRIGKAPEELKFLCETDLDSIAEILMRTTPEVVIIDSIQTMFNSSVQAAPGSVSQVRETTGVLMRLAKETGITFFIIGHVTKEGTVAGPRVLEHMVDTVLYFEGDRYDSYRVLRGVKNRFGSTNEIGIFEMKREGLVQVENASEYMLCGRPVGESGSVVTCSMEGTRPLLTEVQALVCESSFSLPRRQANGTDYNRVNLLMAVLEQRLGMPLGKYDAYINLAGGIRQTEPALDLGIAMAIVSAYRKRAIHDKMIAFGEIGLSGEVRSVNLADQRVSEAVKMGFKFIVLPKACLKNVHLPADSDAKLIGVGTLREAAELI